MQIMMQNHNEWLHIKKCLYFQKRNIQDDGSILSSQKIPFGFFINPSSDGNIFIKLSIVWRGCA
jgi:hypothetical protein